jgi:hypothetical protein
MALFSMSTSFHFEVENIVEPHIGYGFQRLRCLGGSEQQLIYRPSTRCLDPSQYRPGSGLVVAPAYLDHHCCRA